MLVKSTLQLISSTLPSPFPLQMEILCEHQQIRVLLDGRQLCDFTHRVQPLNLVKALQISGDIRLTKVAWKKGIHNITRRQRQMYFLLSEKWFIFFPWLILESGNCIFFICWCVWSTHLFSHTRSAVTGPGRREGLCWGTLLASQTARLRMLYSISHPHGPLTPGHASWWISVLGSAVAVTLVMRTGQYAVVGARKEKQISL